MSDGGSAAPILRPISTSCVLLFKRCAAVFFKLVLCPTQSNESSTVAAYCHVLSALENIIYISREHVFCSCLGCYLLSCSLIQQMKLNSCWSLGALCFIQVATVPAQAFPQCKASSENHMPFFSSIRTGQHNNTDPKLKKKNRKQRAHQVDRSFSKFSYLNFFFPLSFRINSFTLCMFHIFWNFISPQKKRKWHGWIVMGFPDPPFLY